MGRCSCPSGGPANTVMSRPKDATGYFCGVVPIEMAIFGLATISFIMTISALGTNDWVEHSIDISGGADATLLGAAGQTVEVITHLGLYRAEEVVALKTDADGNLIPLQEVDDDFSGVLGEDNAGKNAFPEDGIVIYKCNQPNPSGQARSYLGFDEDTCETVGAISALLVLAFIFLTLGGMMFFANGAMVRPSRRVKLPSAVFFLGLATFFLLITVGVASEFAEEAEDNYEDVISAFLANPSASTVSISLDTELGTSFSLAAAAFVASFMATILGTMFSMKRSCFGTTWSAL